MGGGCRRVPLVITESDKAVVPITRSVTKLAKRRASSSSLETAKQEQVVNEEMLWHRGDVIHDYREVFQVIGHTPVAEGLRIETHFANIDTGAGYNSKPIGVLTGLQFPEKRIITQPNIDRMEAC